MPPPGICERKGGLGDVCLGYASCLPSLHCSSAYQTGTCIAKGATGPACSNGLDCEDGMFCDPVHADCRPLPRDGGDCTQHGSVYACAPGFLCDFTAPNQLYTCQAISPLGGSCGYDGQCLSNDCEYGTLPDGGFGGTCIPSCSQRADGGT